MNGKSTHSESHLESLKRRYREREEAFKSDADRARSRARALAVVRLLTFFGALVPLIFAPAVMGQALSWTIAVAALVAFVISIRAQNRANEESAFRVALAEINSAEQAVLAGNFSRQSDGLEFKPDYHDYANDLDLFGSRSLYAWLSRAGTFSGRARLANWLLREGQPDEVESILQRQEAVDDLATRLEWRQRFQARAHLLKDDPSDRQALKAWMTRPSKILYHSFWTWTSRTLPIVTLTLWALALVQMWVPGLLGIVATDWAGLFSLLQLILAASHLKHTQAEHAGVSRRMALLERYAKLFEAVEEVKFKAPLLNQWKDGLGSGPRRASATMHRLAGIISSFDMRLNMIMAIVLNAVLLWDIRCVRKLEQWRAEHSADVDAWFEDLGRFDAMLGLATMRDHEKEFCWPDPKATDVVLDAQNLGHPLLPGASRVGNNLRQPPGHLTVITGANMAGKSTFLRSVGVNLVLANLGAPVCASSFRFKPMRVFSSMRTTDSLADGESYFFAELVRLEKLTRRLEAGESLFAMVDEMLKGTNSRDQHAGSLALARRMVELQGNGLLATHDLDLGRLAEELPGKVNNRCFEVFTEGDQMTFDYHLRNGICQNLNATFLMRRMGIMPEQKKS